MSKRTKQVLAKHIAGWSDEQLQRAWDNPERRKDGIVTLRAAKLGDAILTEQIARRNSNDKPEADGYVGGEHPQG